MPGGHTYSDRFLRSTLISDGGAGATIAQASSTAGTTANNTTIARYSVGGTTSARDFSPTKTTTTAPAARGATESDGPLGDGWRESTAQVNSPTTDQFTTDLGVSLDLRIRYRRSGQALEVDQQANIIAFLYHVASDGTFIKHLVNAQVTGLTFTTTTQTATLTFNNLDSLPSTDPQVFAANDRFQVEITVTTTALGVPTAPAVATDLWFVLDETDANSGGKFKNNATTYTVQFARSRSETVGAAADVISRIFTGFRTISEAVGAAADTVSRAGSGFHRTITETLTAATDAVARIYHAVRERTETVSFNDTISRLFTGARTISETVGPAADTVTRIYNAIRSRIETLGPVTDTVSRIVQFNRTRNETLAAITDTVSRVFTGARTRTESLSLSDLVSRIYHGNRTVGEGPGDYPLNDGRRSLSGQVLDEDHPNNPGIPNITVYLFRSSDKQYVGQSSVTDGSGNYLFPRDSNDPNSYFVLVTTDGNLPPAHGVSDDGLVPS
jgi:hypothetical protein